MSPVSRKLLMPHKSLPVLLQPSVATHASGPLRLSAQPPSSDTVWATPFAQVQAVGDSDEAPRPASHSQQAHARGPSVRRGSDRSPFAQVQQQQPQARTAGGDLTAASPFAQVQQAPQQARSSSRELSPSAAVHQQPAGQRSGDAASASPFAQAQLQEPAQGSSALQTTAFTSTYPAAGQAEQALGFGSGDLVAGQPAPQAQQQPAKRRSADLASASPFAEIQQQPQARSSGDESSSSGDQQGQGHSLSTLAAATAGAMSPDEAGHSGTGSAEPPAMTSPFAGQRPFSGQLLELKADCAAHLPQHCCSWGWGHRKAPGGGGGGGKHCLWQVLPCL